MQQLSLVPSDVPLRRFNVTDQQAVVNQQNRNEEAERSRPTPPWSVPDQNYQNYQLLRGTEEKSSVGLLVGILVVVGVIVVAAGVSGQRALEDRKRRR